MSMGTTCPHGFLVSMPCKECRKASAKWDRENLEWAIFIWRCDGEYPRERAVDGRVYKTNHGAEMRCEMLNGNPNFKDIAPEGFVVRGVMKLKACPTCGKA